MTTHGAKQGSLLIQLLCFPSPLSTCPRLLSFFLPAMLLFFEAGSTECMQRVIFTRCICSQLGCHPEDGTRFTFDVPRRPGTAPLPDNAGSWWHEQAHPMPTLQVSRIASTMLKRRIFTLRFFTKDAALPVNAFAPISALQPIFRAFSEVGGC